MRNNFYEDGSMIPSVLPEHFRKTTSAEACGNCGMYSNRRSFCGIYRTMNVKDNYI